ncbi:hypothetical protein EG329_008065 [Mollisiaceae sp. DMI_Dod_QoI]|nr:hypothetical protein EG329_008065 [Helotiales sp. DMI_Dod_QoI]
MASNEEIEESDLASKPTKDKFTRNFDPIWENGECTLVLNESLPQAERIKLAFDVPELLNERRLLTKAEVESTGYTELEPEKTYWIKGLSGRYPGAIRMSAPWLKEQGLLQRLAPLREKLLSEEFKENLASKSVSSGWSLKKNGGRFLLGLTEKPTYGWNTIQLGSLSLNAEDLDAQDLIVKLTEIVSEATRLVIPDIDEMGREDRWHQKASLTIGSRKNHVYTNIQLNYTKEGENLKESLKKFGGVHRDRQNDPTVLTALVSLSHPSEDYFAGRFNVTSLHLTATLLPYEIILFPGRFFHCSTGTGEYSVPRGSPFRLPPPDPELIPPLPEGTEFMRFVMPLWSSARIMKPELKCLNEHLYSSIGEGIFESKAHQYEWMMRFYIVNEPEIRFRIGDKISSEAGSGRDQLLQAYHVTQLGESTAEIARLASAFPRNGIPENYIQLFGYTDEETGKFVLPDKEVAVKTLHALTKSTSNFDSYFKEMTDLNNKIGTSSPATPIHAERRRLREIAAQSRSVKSSRKQNGDSDSESDDYSSSKEVKNSNAKKGTKSTAGPAHLENERPRRLAKLNASNKPRNNNESESDSDTEDTRIDFRPLKLAEMMDKFSEAKIHPLGNKDLTAAIVAIGIALKSLISYTMSHAQPKGDSSKTSEKKSKRVATVDLTQEDKKKYKTDSRTSTHDGKEKVASEKELKESYDSIEVDDGNLDEEYEIEAIVGKRPTRSGQSIYLVQWKGWGPEWDEWKMSKDLKHAKDLVDVYERQCTKWDEDANMQYDDVNSEEMEMQQISPLSLVATDLEG